MARQATTQTDENEVPMTEGERMRALLLGIMGGIGFEPTERDMLEEHVDELFPKPKPTMQATEEEG